MYCSKCGRAIADGSVFCTYCGATMGSQTPAQPAGYGQPQYPASFGGSGSPILASIKRIGKSSLYLTAVILMSIGVVMPIFIPSGSIMGTLMSVASMAGISQSELNSLMGGSMSMMLGAGSIFSNLISALPSILVLVGLWMVYAKCASQTNAPFSTAGLTMIRVVFIVELVCVCLVIGIAEIAVLGLGAVANSAFGAGGGGAAVIMVIVALIGVVPILYNLQVIKILKGAVNSVRTGSNQFKGFGFLTVLVWIAAIGGILGGLTGLFSNFLGGLCSMCGDVAVLLFALVLGSLKRELMQPSVNTQMPNPMDFQATVSNQVADALSNTRWDPDPVSSGGQTGFYGQQNDGSALPFSGWNQAEPEVARDETAGQPANGETTFIFGDTTVLQPKQAPAYLYRSKTGEKIDIQKPNFLLGKGRVDYSVSDNTSVSRNHATIVYHDNAYFIIDAGSTNHTYVNGTMISNGTEVPLESGASVVLADEEFYFYLG